MPYINSASIQSGQIIQANHVLNIINTFNDTANTDIKVKGTASFNEVEIKNLKVFGTASIDTFITTYYSSSVLYASGSTKFGDSADDTHQYTGSLGVSGSLRVNGTTQLGILGVNTKSPLVLNPDTSGGSVYYVKNDGAFVIGTGGDPYSGGVDAVAVNGFGNVSIGKTVPTSKLDVLGNVAVTGSVNVTGNITAGGLIGTASHALSSSFATTASYALNAGTTVFTGSFATTGSNTLRGTQLFTGSIRLVGDQTITGSLTISGSNTFTNIGPTVLIGSLVAKGGDNISYLSANRSVNTTINTTSVPTTATVNASAYANNNYDPMSFSFLVDSNFDIFFSGVSGSGETQAFGGNVFSGGNAQSIAFGASLDIGNEGLEPITLSPTGTIESYKLFIYNYGTNGTGWYIKTTLDSMDLQNGTTVMLTGNTDSSLGTDLLSAGFSFSPSNPTGSSNTITYPSQSISTSTTSSVAVNAPLTITGSLLVTQNITGNLIGSASNAISSSFAVTASYALNGGSGTTFTGSFATTGSNTFIGNQVVSGSVNITGSLTVSGSSTFTNIGPTILRGTLAVVGEDGSTFLSASRTISSSLSSSFNVDTATFNGTGFIILDPEDGTGAYRWNSNFDVYYSGTSGSGAYETELSRAFNAVSDNRNYDTFTIGFDSGISLVSGSIEAYNLYVNDLAKAEWFKLEGLKPAGFTNGTPVRLSGASISDDLKSAGFTKIKTDPTSNVNTIIYRQSYTFFTTQSALVLDSPRIYPTSSGTPTTTGSDGQFLFGTDGGKHYIYVWMNGGWRSGSLV